MEKQKQELIKIIMSINNPKMVDYLYNLIKTFLELRS